MAGILFSITTMAGHGFHFTHCLRALSAISPEAIICFDAQIVVFLAKTPLPLPHDATLFLPELPSEHLYSYAEDMTLLSFVIQPVLDLIETYNHFVAYTTRICIYTIAGGGFDMGIDAYNEYDGYRVANTHYTLSEVNFDDFILLGPSSNCRIVLVIISYYADHFFDMFSGSDEVTILINADYVRCTDGEVSYTLESRYCDYVLLDDGPDAVEFSIGGQKLLSLRAVYNSIRHLIVSVSVGTIVSPLGPIIIEFTLGDGYSLCFM